MVIDWANLLKELSTNKPLNSATIPQASRVYLGTEICELLLLLLAFETEP